MRTEIRQFHMLYGHWVILEPWAIWWRWSDQSSGPGPRMLTRIVGSGILRFEAQLGLDRLLDIKKQLSFNLNLQAASLETVSRRISTNFQTSSWKLPE